MKTSKPPFIAAWLLDRFGADPQLDAIAGDLLEQYRLGRSRVWYWREVITAIIAGMWSEFWDHKLVVTRGLVIGWIMICAGTTIGALVVEPLFSLILPDYPDSGPSIFLALLLFAGPWCVLTGWIVAQCAHVCRIPAVLGFAVSYQSFLVLLNPPPTKFDNIFQHLSWTFLLQVTVLTTLILLGGGLLTGPPKRSMLAQPGSPLDESSES